MATQIKLRRDTAVNWFNANPVLGQGEPGYDITNKKLKIGDGVLGWNALGWFDDQVTDLTAHAGNIVPDADNTRTLGTALKRWNHLYVGPGSITIGDAVLTIDQGKLNSSVGFAVDNLTLNGVELTVNQSGQVESSAGFAVAPSDVLPADAAGVLTNDGTGILSWGAGGGSAFTGDLGSNTLTQSFSFTKTIAHNIALGTSDIVWSGSFDYISSAKLTIQVECTEDGDASGWHSQACEAIIASRGYASVYGGPGGDPQMTVYGVVHTSVAPLVTFTVQRNPTTKLIEVVGTTTAAANGQANLRIHSVEMGTTD